MVLKKNTEHTVGEEIKEQGFHTKMAAEIIILHNIRKRELRFLLRHNEESGLRKISHHRAYKGEDK